MMTKNTPLTIILATGGTGGHIFPAEALAEELIARGHTPIFITDKRFGQYLGQGKALDGVQKHVISAAAIGGSLPQKIIGMLKNILAFASARAFMKRVRPDVVIGFGGYPSLPTMLASIGSYPTMIHEQNALLGRANRILAARVDIIAASFSLTDRLKAEDKAKMRIVGNPVRAAILALRHSPYSTFAADGIMHLLVTGGSQGASILGEVVPKAIALLPESLRVRVQIEQQVRAEQMDEIKAAYTALHVVADLAPFFSDMPKRLARAHVVIARAGASTVAELTCAGRPAILIPLPNAADDHQTMNAQAMENAGGAWLMPQHAFTPEALASRLESFLNLPDTLTHAATAAHSIGRPDAAIMLADIVIHAASGNATFIRN